MKKAIVLTMMLCIAAGAGWAEALSSETHTDTGDFIVSAGIDYSGWGLGLGGGAEYMFYRWDIPGFLPLTVGATAKAGVYFFDGFHLGLGAMATAHLGTKGITVLPEYLQNMDWYYALGLGLGIGDNGGFGIATGSGVAYYINPTLAVAYEFTYFGAGRGSTNTLGVRLEL